MTTADTPLSEPEVLAAWQGGAAPAPAPDPADPRIVPLATLPNLRDIGGLAGEEGELPRGLVFRSAAPDRISPTDVQAVTDLGVGLVADLRTSAERSAAPSAWTLPQQVFDVLGDTAGADAAQVGAFLTDPAAAATYLAAGVGRGHMLDTYRDLVLKASARKSYQELFLLLADPTTPPLLFHCTTGKDRTGWAAAALLLLCGVDEEAVRADYLLSNTQLLPVFEPLFTRVEQAGADASGLRAVLGVDADYLDLAQRTMQKEFGGVEGYFTTGLGLAAAEQLKLRARLTSAN